MANETGGDFGDGLHLRYASSGVGARGSGGAGNSKMEDAKRQQGSGS